MGNLFPTLNSYDPAQLSNYQDAQLIDMAPSLVRHYSENFPLINDYLNEVRRRFGKVDIKYRDGLTFPHLAVYYAKNETTATALVHHLLEEYQFDINSPTDTGGNLFVHMVQYLETDQLFRLLVDRGVNINSFDPYFKETAIDKALALQKGDLIRYFQDLNVRSFQHLASHGTKPVQLEADAISEV